MKKIIFILIYLFGNFISTFSQNTELNSLYARWSTVTNDQERVDILNEIAFQQIGINPLVSKDTVITAYKLAVKINYVQGEARSLGVMGGVNWGFGDYEEALLHYLDALKIYRDLDDTIGRSNCLNNIGEVYKKLGQYNSALDYLLLSKDLKEQQASKSQIALAYSNLGELYTLMQDYENAHKFYDMAQQTVKESDLRIRAYIEDGLGSLYFAKKNYSDAIPKFNRAAILRQKINDNRGLAYAYDHLGQSFSELGIIDSAYFYFKAALRSAYSSSASDIRISIYKSMASLDSIKSDFSSAFENYKTHASLRDSIFSVKKSTQIARLQEEYQNEILIKENEARTAQLRQRNTLIIAAIMLIFLIGSLAYGLYRQRHGQKLANEVLKKKNLQIERQNIEIQSQSDELKILNEDLENLNKNLEEKISKRTALLEQRNNKLAEYAFIHAHELRAPVANILGLVELLGKANLADEEEHIIQHLTTATERLDSVIKEIIAKESPKV